MRSTFGGIEISKRGLFTEQAALSTTGHNIANANTKGFSRQVVNMVASVPIEYPGMMRSNVPGQLGQGVEFESITRVREKFLDDQFYNENMSLGTWTIRQDTLEKLEKIVNEPSDSGIRSLMSKFWNAWSDLSKDPENIDGRKILRETALAFTDALNSTSKRLTDLSGDLSENISVKASQVNSIISSVDKLNLEIRRIEGLGDDANDLRDQRDLLMDDLSNIVNISVVETDRGYNISMGSVSLLTPGTAPTPVTSESLQEALASGDLNSGEVHGMIVSRDTYVADYIKELDKIASTLTTGEVTVTIPKGSVLPEGTVLNGVTYSGAARTLTSDLTVKVNGVNGLHKLGYNFKSPYVGGDFFTVKGGGTTFTAANIQLNPAFIDSPELIASSMRTTGTGASEQIVKGDNTLAVLFSQLKDAKFSFPGSGDDADQVTVDDYFRSVVGQLGVQTSEAKRQANNSKDLVDQVESRRQSVSGVSLDEEMANMIKFQHAYNAAARSLTTFDEMLDKVINGMGVVGR
ncbi:flagellar hook-associated protein FlgK [Paenibacillus sedimenti]|uniref:Flagellar hook-associated protein 1 n=1 Tax=Paenibacillus sedimenti TaxID=2770274 RepID=A0A926KVQ4_9BACL|nr:flagellar hook-associated protein FlgK [Paenibacillus sedimenti]MBD0384183.1 flagellar hook-associated protein FlgK [Paenibacillus sedimenti]